MDQAKPSMKGMKLRIYNSWEDAAAAEIQDTLRQSPEERIRETVALILRVYGVTEEVLKQRRGKLRIKMKYYNPE